MSQKNVGERAIDAIVGALDKALAPPAPPKPEEAAAKTISAAIKGRFNGDPAVEKRIIDMDGKWNDYRLVLENSGYLPAKAAYLEHQKLQQQMIVEGNFTGDFFTLQDWVEEMAERGMAARRQMSLLGQQAAVLCRPICQAVARILTEQADTNDREDQEKYENFSVPFAPSPLSARLRQLAAIVLARVASGGGSSRPKSLAPFLFND